MTRTDPTPRIGTHGRSGYNRGCRCDVCVTANRQHQRERRQRDLERARAEGRQEAVREILKRLRRTKWYVEDADVERILDDVARHDPAVQAAGEPTDG